MGTRWSCSHSCPRGELLAIDVTGQADDVAKGGTGTCTTSEYLMCGDADSSTLTYPRCTESPNYFLSDCGSSSWSYGLYLSWNILSMCVDWPERADPQVHLPEHVHGSGGRVVRIRVSDAWRRVAESGGDALVHASTSRLSSPQGRSKSSGQSSTPSERGISSAKTLFASSR